LNWTFKGDGYTFYSINMTSQKWLTENDSNSSIWYHTLNIAVPDVLKVKDTAFFYIANGNNNNDPK
jgi:PhoPQ-activated pathogenicity-related protein